VFDEMGGSSNLASSNALHDALCLVGDLAAAESFVSTLSAKITSIELLHLPRGQTVATALTRLAAYAS
jgi:hypothetical protein